jgi:hypothetical protein
LKRFHKISEIDDVEINGEIQFHSELNFIERVWANAESALRSTCTFNFKDLQARLPATLDAISSQFIRKSLSLMISLDGNL